VVGMDGFSSFYFHVCLVGNQQNYANSAIFSGIAIWRIVNKQGTFGQIGSFFSKKSIYFRNFFILVCVSAVLLLQGPED
jgi:hypothetical protein